MSNLAQLLQLLTGSPPAITPPPGVPQTPALAPAPLAVPRGMMRRPTFDTFPAPDPTDLGPVRSLMPQADGTGVPNRMSADEARMQAEALQPQLRGSVFRQDPRAMQAALGAVMQNMPGFAGVSAPQIEAPTRADVNRAAMAMGGDPRTNAAAATGAGLNDYLQPEFLARPPGEDQLEDFAFRELVALGDKAPRAMQNAWLGIQQNKAQRLVQRADYHAQLIKLRHNADLQARNASLADYADNQRLAARNLMQLRLTQAEMDFQARRDTAAAANQFGASQRAAIDAFAKAGLKSISPPTVEQRAKLETEFVNPAASAWAAAQTGRRFYKSALAIADRLGMGALSGGMQGVMKAVGGRAAREFSLNWSALRKDLVSSFAEEAGARAIDTPAELRSLLSTIPDEGADADVIARWVTNWVKTSTKTFERKLSSVNDLYDGYGDVLREDIIGGDEVEAMTNDIIRALGSQAP